MNNRDYRDTDRNASRSFDLPDDPFARQGAPAGRGGFDPLRRPYPDRAPANDPFPRYAPREDAPVYPDYAANGNVNLYTPKSYADVQSMIDILRRNESIIVNLEGIESASAQRILDFLSGAAYALGGSMRRLDEKRLNFLITPQGMGITDTNGNRNY